MPSTLVIADLHLCPSRPEITDCFFRFLTENLDQHDALYILGDLFEAWIGDDDKSEFNLSVANAIKAFSSNTPVYFIHGNRDFLIGHEFAKRSGMKLLPENYKTTLYDRPVLFMHGDQLCLDDIDYQAFRKRSRSWWWKKLMLILPLKKRKKIAANIRKKSKESQLNKSINIMDVAEREVNRVVDYYQCDWLIHGHTHRPNIHQLANSKKRMVVGDWYEQGSVLIITKEKGQLSTLPFRKHAN
ncbi:UDP-2,3-diacylglucosamine diphosphatase [Psychrosphaera aestuarii]|uniref:UDP-2,3-diacylglucosamine diphosphatase n=1 Tax=Psychrosphaera aestuarii TaxID=1266052 RepID=UPI001B31AE92|nr:UDP-2,3-diacylglucosamine diphosphatase [Psychrosphaera aestuarii]